MSPERSVTYVSERTKALIRNLPFGASPLSVRIQPLGGRVFYRSFNSPSLYERPVRPMISRRLQEATP